MAKSTKHQPARKPVRARGALPVPKVAPPRSSKAWFRHPGYQLVAMVIVIAVIGAGVKVGGDFMRDRKQTTVNKRALSQLEKNFQVLEAPVSDSLTAMTNAPPSFSAGAIPAADFKKQTDLWLSQFRKVDAGLRKRTLPPDFPELEEARALLVQGNLVYIDSVKAFQAAADAPDPAARGLFIKQGTNLAGHASSIIATGDRVIVRLKQRYGLTSDAAANTPAGLPAVQLPNEEAAAPTTGQPVPGEGITAPGQTAPGQGVPGQTAPGQ